MAQRVTIVLSDLHFGNGDDLLHSPSALKILEPELSGADTLVLNGDVWDLISVNLATAVEASRPFFAMVAKNVKEIIYLPGNHDYHLVAAATDRHEFSKLIDIADETPFRLYLAELLLKELTFGKVQIRSAYPVIEIDGMTYHHGHYISPHLRNTAWRMFDLLSWRLAGLERRQQNLTSSEYEAILAPLHELLYHSAQLPSSKQTMQSGEKALLFAAKAMRLPGRIGRKATSPFRKHLTDDFSASNSLFQITSPAQAVEAMQMVCTNLGLSAGPICIGHSHAPFDNMIADGWTFHNSGSWVLDHREKRYPHYKYTAWPGTILRVENMTVTRKELLTDYRLKDLENMLAEQSDLPLRRRRRRWLRKKPREPEV